MRRVLFVLALALAAPAVARAESLPSFSSGRCETEATHVVVVDNTGKVLESWRGDLRPDDVLPLVEFRLKLAHEVSKFAKKEGGPDKVTGKRLVLFLKKGGPKYDRGRAVGSWGGAHWVGDFNVSTLWVEDGQAFALEQWINPGDQEMSYAGTEAEFKRRVERVNATVRDLLARARAEKKIAERAKVLADIAVAYPGFSPEAFAGLEWCGADALPAIRSILKPKQQLALGDAEELGAYSVLAKIGAPARDDLMKQLEFQLAEWKRLSEKVQNWGKLEPDERRTYRVLLAATSNPEALQGATAEQRKTLRELRDLWVDHPVLSKLGEKGDRVADRLDRVLPRQK